MRYWPLLAIALTSCALLTSGDASVGDSGTADASILDPAVVLAAIYNVALPAARVACHYAAGSDTDASAIASACN